MIRFATIGTSKITEGVLEAARQCEGFELYAVYSRQLEKARSFAESQGAQVAYDSLEKLAADPMVDAVYIASPNSLHYEQAMLLMKSGKHVLCEKALASNRKEAEEMIRTATDNKVILLEAMRLSFDPGMKAIKDNLYKLGDVRNAHLEYCQYSSRYDAFKAGDIQNIFRHEMSAGALMDIGVYCIHAMIDIFDAPQFTYGTSVLLSNGIDGAGSITAKYSDKVVSVSYSKITGGVLPSQIQGEKGVMIFTEVASQRDIKIRYYDGSEETVPVPNIVNNKVYEIAYFIDAIKGEKDVSRYNQISLEALTIMDRTRQQSGIVFPADNH